MSTSEVVVKTSSVRKLIDNKLLRELFQTNRIFKGSQLWIITIRGLQVYFSAKKQCKDDAILELFYFRDPGFSTIFTSFCTKSPTSFHDPISDVL